MPDKRIAGRAPCPCGSGQPYGSCCQGKGFDWMEDADGCVYLKIKLPRLAHRHCGPRENALLDDHDPDAKLEAELLSQLPHPEHLEAMLVEGMAQANIDPAIIYAFEKTGLLVTEDNQHLISDAELAQWDAAVEEYVEQQLPTEFPCGSVALYGPDDKHTTMIVVGVAESADTEPVVRRFVGSQVRTNARVCEEIESFFAYYNVASVSVSEGNIGCHHEEGLDYLVGEDCPFCHYWKGKQ